MWHCYPHLVKMEHAKDNPHHIHKLYNIDPRHGSDTLCYVPSSRAEMQKVAEKAGGTVGRPSRSDRAAGGRYHRHLVDRLVAVIEDLQDERR